MAVKQSKRDYIDELYDSFRVKDMTRREFRNRYIAALDPRGIRRDVLGMVDQIHEGKQLRRKISGSLS